VILAIQNETSSAVAAMQSETVQVEAGVKTAAQAGVLLQEIIQSAEHLGKMVTEIASAANEQSASAEAVNNNIEKISKITAATAQGSQESARACRNVTSLAQSLQEVVGLFKVDAEVHGEGSDSSGEGRELHGMSTQPWNVGQIPMLSAAETRASAVHHD
jgi:methyl-accepting chemotaxis protein